MAVLIGWDKISQNGNDHSTEYFDFMRQEVMHFFFCPDHFFLNVGLPYLYDSIERRISFLDGFQPNPIDL